MVWSRQCQGIPSITDALNEEIGVANQRLATLVGRAAPRLLKLEAIGIDHAGQLLVTAGQRPERLRGEAAFAHLCGAAPVPASSGTTHRHRLHRSGDRLQLRLATPATAVRAAELVADLGSGPPQVDAQAGEVTVLIPDGVAVLPEVVRRLDAAGLALSDLAVRRPTLDDVFLTLTGHATQPPDPLDAPAPDHPRPQRQPATRSPA